jgi:hypothetical protein
VVCGECEKCEKGGGTRLDLGERVSVGRGEQVSKLTDMLACINLPTDIWE